MFQYPSRPSYFRRSLAKEDQLSLKCVGCSFLQCSSHQYLIGSNDDIKPRHCPQSKQCGCHWISANSELRIEPGPLGRKAWMLPLCYGDPRQLKNIFAIRIVDKLGKCLSQDPIKILPSPAKHESNFPPEDFFLRGTSSSFKQPLLWLRVLWSDKLHPQ